MKKLILFISLITLMFSADAQSGATCPTAMNLISADSCYGLSINAPQSLWVKFQATSASMLISLSNIIDTLTSYRIDSIKIYDNSCSPFDIIAGVQRDSATRIGSHVKEGAVGDELVEITLDSIIIGNTYYVNIILSSTGCGGCSDTINFDLCFKSMLFCPSPFDGCNLIKNKSFEEYANCPFYFGEIYKACGWTQPVPGGSGSSTDYFNTCAFGADAYIPVLGQYPRTGVGCAGFCALAPTIVSTIYREYVQQKIFTPLIAGKTYYLEMYVMLSLADANYYVDQIGAYFTATQPVTSIVTRINVVPQIVNPALSYLTSTGWQKVSGCYTAVGGEEWITIGTFKFVNGVAFSNPNITNPGYKFSYYYLDDVTLTMLNTDAGNDQTLACEGDQANLGNLMCPIPGQTFNWTPTSGLSNPSIVNPIATPTATTTYTLTTSIPGAASCVANENVTVTVLPINLINAGADVSICAGFPTVLNASGGSGYVWSPSTGLSCTACANPDANPTVTTTYTLTGTNPNGCIETDFVTVTVNPLPNFVVTGSTTSCAGSVPNYTISPVQAGVNYTWSTTTGASGTGSIAFYSFPTTGGTITFTGTYTATGCTFTTSLYVGSCCAPAGVPNFTNKNATLLASIGSSSGGTVTISNQTFALNGTFTVDQNLILNGCNVLMGYLGKINLDPGKTLTITDGTNGPTHIYACNEMWDGIFVTNPTSLVVVNNGSTIEDALNAIVSDNKGNFQINGSIVQGNVIFNKNYKSIVVKNALTGSHPGYVRATTIQCYDGVVGGNPTNTLNKLHFPHSTKRSNIGIELTNVNSIIIGTPVAIKLNTFDNLDFGINSSNSSLSVYNNNFKNITLTGSTLKDECLPGTAICAKGGKAVLRTINVGSISSSPFYKNTFSNDAKGVVATEYMSASVWKNNFANVTTGIRVSKNYTRNLIINENVINNSRVGIDCFDNQSANVTIDNNDIDAGTLLQASGVLAQEILAGTTVYKISRNTIKNVRYGIFGIGLKNSNVDRNNIYLKHTTVPTQECYGVRLANSSFCNVVANWVLGTNSADYWIHGISLDLCTSDYVVCNESHILGTGMFFGGNQTPNTFIAKNLMKNNYRGLVINFGIVGQQGVVGTPNDNRWAGSFTYHTFSYNSFCAAFPWYVRAVGAQFNPSPYLYFTTFLGNQVPLNSTSGTLPLACPLIIGGGGPPRTPIMLQIAGDSIAPPAYDVSARWMLKQSLYQYLKTDPSLITTEPLIAQFKNEYTINNMGKLDDVETSLSDPTTITTSVLSSIQALNNTITPASDVEINSKWMNGLLIENALTGSDYSVSQLNDLRILAAKCPYNDGPAVYQARVILNQVEDIEYMNGCEIVPDVSYHSMSAFTQPDESENNEFKLFPNPNDGTMNFIYSLNETSKGDMKIFDLTGKIVASYPLKIGINNQILINETQLSNGVYFYKVIIDNELKSSDKIVIIK